VKRAALERDLDARIVRGLVYVDGVFGPGFDPHAWTEVWMERQWFQVDAIFEQPVADATHIPVTPGDVLSRVPLRVVEVQ
jgi:transglutaminase/protease-like cytokinesis protein 3